MKFANKPQISFDEFSERFTEMMERYFDTQGLPKPLRIKEKEQPKEEEPKEVTVRMWQINGQCCSMTMKKRNANKILCKWKSFKIN